jgi:hypothetical protein
MAFIKGTKRSFDPEGFNAYWFTYRHDTRQKCEMSGIQTDEKQPPRATSGT